MGNGTPGRKPRVTEKDVLKLFADRDDRGEPLTATEVADTLRCSRPTAFEKLKRLRNRGDITSKKVGAKARVYWVPIERPENRSLSEFEEAGT